MSPTPDNPDPEPPSDGLTELAPGVRVPPGAIAWTFSRGGGPGGQNVNKVATRATLTLDLAPLAESMPRWAYDRLIDLAGQRYAAEPPRLILTSSEHRSQARNRDACTQRLRDLLVQATHRPKRRRPTRIPKGVIERRLRNKKHRADRKRERRDNRRP